MEANSDTITRKISNTTRGKQENSLSWLI